MASQFASMPPWRKDQSELVTDRNITVWNSLGNAPSTLPNSKPQLKLSAAGQAALMPASNNVKKVNRVKGGNAPISKPITMDYDEEDALIIRLKTGGYTDKDVAQRLRDEGFSNYHDRTIGSRWNRLRRMLEEEDDKVLDDNMSDWHLGEDDKLVEAYEAIEAKIQEEIDKLEAKRWSQVSSDLAIRLRKKKYSSRACKERFDGLNSGSALEVIELDSDQEGRRVLRERRISQALKARADRESKNKADRRAREDSATSSKRARINSAREKAEMAERKAEEKLKSKHVREERRANQERMRATKQALLKSLKDNRDWEMLRHRKEKEIYKRLTGKDLNHELREAKEALIEYHKDIFTGEATGDDNGYSNLDIEKWIYDHDTDPAGLESRQPRADTPTSNPTADNAQPAKTGKPQPLAQADPLMRPSTLPDSLTKLAYPSNIPRVRFRAPVTQETLLSPRSILTDDELSTLLRARALPPRGRTETHAETVARLNAADWDLIVPDLKQLLRAAGYRTEGRKEEMIRRLQEADAEESFKGVMGVEPTDLDFMRSYSPYRGEFKETLAAYEKAERVEGIAEGLQEEIGERGEGGVESRDGEEEGKREAEGVGQEGGGEDGGEGDEVLMPTAREESIEEEIRVAMPNERAASVSKMA